MRKMIVLVVLMVVVFVFFRGACKAQSPETIQDSVKYYRKQIRKIYRNNADSLRRNGELQLLWERERALTAKSDNYSAFILYFQSSSADFRKFNADNSANNFPPMSGNLTSIGFGFSNKKKRRVFDLNFLAFGVNKSVSKENENIKANFSTGFEFQWGYAFVKSRVVNVYPFLGLGLRGTVLTYNSNIQASSAPTNIINVIQNNRSSSTSVTEVGFQAGIGLDMLLTKANESGGVMLFAKGGTSRAIHQEVFDIQGFKYQPNLGIGEWMVMIGFKFFGRE